MQLTIDPAPQSLVFSLHSNRHRPVTVRIEDHP